MVKCFIFPIKNNDNSNIKYSTSAKLSVLFSLVSSILNITATLNDTSMMFTYPAHLKERDYWQHWITQATNCGSHMQQTDLKYSPVNLRTKRCSQTISTRINSTRIEVLINKDNNDAGDTKQNCFISFKFCNLYFIISEPLQQSRRWVSSPTETSMAVIT